MVKKLERAIKALDQGIALEAIGRLQDIIKNWEKNWSPTELCWRTSRISTGNGPRRSLTMFPSNAPSGSAAASWRPGRGSPTNSSRATTRTLKAGKP
jgi:hypothetical protein